MAKTEWKRIERKQQKIIHVDDSFAYTDGETIYLHKDLVQYPKLYSAVLGHELKHDDKWFSIKDFMNDITFKLPKDEFRAFKKSHPKLMYRSLLPISKNGINVNIIIIYVLSVILVYSVMRGILWLNQSLL